jgi:hypothetical protein
VTSLLGKLVWLFPESVPLEDLFTEAVAQPSAAHVTHPYSPRCLEEGVFSEVQIQNPA